MDVSEYERTRQRIRERACRGHDDDSIRAGIALCDCGWVPMHHTWLVQVQCPSGYVIATGYKHDYGLRNMVTGI